MKKLLPVVLFASLTCYATSAGAGELKLADPFGDQMVLQREMPIPVWGDAPPYAAVKVTFANASKSTKADAQGHWMMELGALPASFDNRTLTIESGGGKQEVKDILVGEVWLCAGQSNMNFGNVSFSEKNKNMDEDMRLRVTKVARSATPLLDIADNGKGWHRCITPPNGKVVNFSAPGYAFGASLRKELKVPVGMIQSSVGGTAIELWWPPRATSGIIDPKTKRAGPNGEHYNAMIVPWTHTPVRGVIWYQGESNVMQHDGAAYGPKMKTLIAEWRQAWGRKPADFPFFFVQVAPFAYGKRYPEKKTTADDLPLLWQAQFKVMQETENSGIAHTQELGEEMNIHPGRKKETGERLARLALSRTYKIKTQNGTAIMDDTGPEFKSATLKNHSVVVEFEHAKSGLVSTDGKPLTFFEVAGPDGEFGRSAVSSV